MKGWLSEKGKNECEKLWKKTYGTCPPIPFILRDKFKDRWIRFHYFSIEKRYPRDDKERIDIMSFLYLLMSDIINKNEKYFVILYSFILFDVETPLVAISELGQLNQLKNVSLFEIDPIKYSEDEIISISYTKKQWKTNSIDNFLNEIIWGKVNQSIFMETCYGNVVMPYDGGVDIIIKDEETKTQLKEKFGNWLSKHPLGL